VRNNKRAQGGSAATVIGIITLLFVFYILFIPPEERVKLLLDDGEDGSHTYTSDTYNRTLLLANIGRLDYIAESAYDHTMPNAYLTMSKNAQVISAFSPFVIEHSTFTNKNKEVTFNILEPDKTENVLLVFEAPVRTGVLTVKLNNQVIFESTIDSQNPAPIPLRRAQLSNINTLSFELNGVGMAFWRTNEMQFRNVQVIGDVSDEQYQRSTTVFTLIEEEARNMKKATLWFYPVCDRNQVGLVEAFVNDNRVLSERPDCDSINKIELDTNKLHTGANTLQMRTTQGTMRIEQIRIKTELESTKSYVDYFFLNQTEYERVQNGDRHVKLQMDFVDDNQDKIGTVNINGRLSTFDQTNATYRKDVSDVVQEGNNYVELRPETVLNVVRLGVLLER
jgi:hypothetical protein